MKRTKFIALALVVAVMLMGAAYAAWTDRLDVETKISTGELNVQFQPKTTDNDAYWASPRTFYLHNDAPGRGQWNLASATANDLFTASVQYSAKKMTFTFNNMYPGTRAAGKYEIENVGTVPAVIDNVTVLVTTTDPGPDGVAQVEGAIRVNKSKLSIVRDGVVIDSESLDNLTLYQLEGAMESFLRGKRIQPNDKVILSGNNVENFAPEIGEEARSTFNFDIPYDSLSGDAGEKESVKIEIGFDFIQHNMYDPTPGA